MFSVRAGTNMPPYPELHGMGKPNQNAFFTCMPQINAKDDSG
jgi:hypothetical protein